MLFHIWLQSIKCVCLNYELFVKLRFCRDFLSMLQTKFNQSINDRQGFDGMAGNTKELAEAYLYLMRGSFTTGQIIVVDGGSLLV